MPADFHWLRPAWLLAIPFVVGIAVLLARRQLGAGHWRDVVDPALMPYVLSRSARRGTDWRWWLFGLAGVIAAFAMAGPAWQRIEQPVFRADQALVIALDLSRSMDAEDIAPSRLDRARLKILGMLDRRQGGQTALLVYTSHAFTVTPLTDDTDTVAALVNSLTTDIMPSRGSYPEVGIRKGQSLLEQAGVGYGEVLLVTDGGASPAAEAAARELRDAGYALSILGVGTRAGAPIPRTSGGFVKDNRGQIAVARLDAISPSQAAADTPCCRPTTATSTTCCRAKFAPPLRRETIRWRRTAGARRARGWSSCCCRSRRWLFARAGCWSWFCSSRRCHDRRTHPSGTTCG
ncbi:MAG: VWA domain-containing protein [Woeseiaceae bacterium]